MRNLANFKKIYDIFSTGVSKSAELIKCKRGFTTRKAGLMNKRLKFIRRTFDLTQAELANALGVSTSTVSNWEANLQTVPIKRIQEISERFGIDLEWLKTGIGTPFPELNKSEQQPYEYAIAKGCDPVISKLFEAICTMDDTDRKEFSRLVKQILNIVNGEQIRQQSQQITDFAQKIISTVNFTEPSSQQNQLPLPSSE